MAEAMKWVFLLLVLTSKWEEKGANGTSFKDFIPDDLQQCCHDDWNNMASCSRVDAAMKGPSPEWLLIFYKKYSLEFGMSRNGYPQLLRHTFKSRNDQWAGLKTYASDEDRIQVALDFKDSLGVTKMVFKQQNKLYLMRRNPGAVEKRNIDCKISEVFCHKPNDLKAAASLKNGRGLTNELVVGFYKKSADTFDIKTWGQSKLTIDNVKGKITAVGAYSNTIGGTSSKGVFFDDSGAACFFERLYGDRDLGRIFSLGAGVAFQCWSVQVFFGCPQPFCWRNDVDAITVGQVKDDKKVLLMRGHYIWQMTPKDIPMEVPKRDTANLLESSPFTEFFSFIDAAASIEDPGPGKSGLYTFIFKDNAITVVNKEDRITKEYVEIKDAFPGLRPEAEYIDAAWFDEKKKRMILFKGQSFASFKMEAKGSFHPTYNVKFRADPSPAAWRPLKDHFRGLPADIDAVYPFGDYAYILKQQWYYKVHYLKWDTSGDKTKQYPALPMFGDSSSGFFDHKRDCKDLPMSLDQIRNYLVPFTPKPLGTATAPTFEPPIVTTDPVTDTTTPVKELTLRPTQATDETTTVSGGSTSSTNSTPKKGYLYMVLIIIGAISGILILVLGGLLVLFLLKGKKKQETKRKRGPFAGLKQDHRPLAVKPNDAPGEPTEFLYQYKPKQAPNKATVERPLRSVERSSRFMERPSRSVERTSQSVERPPESVVGPSDSSLY